MNYGRDYGNRNFLDRAASTVRGWLGHRGGHDYDGGYRGGGMRGGWDEDRGGYREMGDVSGGYRGWQGGMEHGYGATNWTGRNADWNRQGDWNQGSWGRGGGEGYRTGGYQPQHGSWDVDWEDRTMPGGGMMNRNGMTGRMSAGMMGSGTDRYDRGYMEGRDFMTNQPAWDRHDAFRDDMEPGMRGGTMNRGMSGGMMGQGSMNRGMMNRGYDRDMGGRDMGGGDWNRQGGGMGTGGMGYGTGMLGRDADVGDVSGGMIGNYGAYGNYGIERFRTGSAGGVPTGQYWTGYGHGSGYRG